MWGTSGRMRDGVRQWRPLSRYGLGAVVAVAAVALMVGSASASPAALATTTKYTAPYPGYGFSGVDLLPAGCGQTASVSVLPQINLTTGKAIADAKDSSRSCGTANSSVELVLYADYESGEFTTTAGVHNLTATWSITLKINLTAKSGGTGQLAESFFAADAATYIYDETNSTEFGSTTPAVLDNFIESGSYSHTYSSVKAQSWVDAKLVKSHTYAFGVDLIIYIATAVTPGKSTATASLTMSGGKDGATLKSISFS